MTTHPNGAPLARIQIDCSGSMQGQQGGPSMFSGLPIGGGANKSSAMFELQQQIAARKEAATGAERQGLLSGDDEYVGVGHGHATCIGRMNRWAPCLLYISCAMTLVVSVVFIILFYIQVNTAVQSIDNAVSIKSRTVSMIQNADRILNRSAEITQLVSNLGGLSLSAAMFSKPYLTQVLNTTTNAIEDMHRLVEKPVIQLNGRRRRQ